VQEIIKTVPKIEIQIQEKIFEVPQVVLLKSWSKFLKFRCKR